MSLSDELQNLEQIAEVLNQMTMSSDCAPRYDILSDALYWEDELPPRGERKPIRAFQTLRFIFRYRTSLIVGAPDDTLQTLWDYALSRFPNWIGFESRRCIHNERLAAVFNSLQQESDRKSGLLSEEN